MPTIRSNSVIATPKGSQIHTKVARQPALKSLPKPIIAKTTPKAILAKPVSKTALKGMPDIKKIAKKTPHVTPRVQTVRINAIVCNQNGKPFYVAVLPSDILEQTCFVARRDEDAEKGFQRTLNKSRANDIAKYLDEQKGTIPSALIVSVQDNSKFAFDIKNNQISFVTNANSLLVLDGQHRLYGLLLAKNKYNIPVILFNGLNTAEEVNLFIDINTTQRGVPTTLLLDIKNLTGRESKKEEKQRDLFDKLNVNSVLAGLLSPSKSKVGTITRVSFNQATSELFESGFFHDKDIDTIYKGVKNYLQAAEKIFKQSKSEKAKLTNSTLFRAIFSIFNDAIDKCLKDFGDLKIESLISTLDPIGKINFDIYTGTSNATLSKVISDMKKEINEYEKRYNSLPQEDLF